MKALGLSGVTALAGCSLTGNEPTGEEPANEDFEYVEATVSEIHRAMVDGGLTAEELTERYLERIEAYDSELKSLISINESALERARELDELLEDSGPVGPLHGVPLVLKDNFDTGDLPTTGGSKALEGVVPPDDATSVRKLRDAGAIVLAKSNMHEFAYGWETHSSLGGQTSTPYDRSHVSGGSSGGSAAAVAANLTALSTGTDTCGSIRVPSAFTNTVGIRGTIGLISRDGIMPMSELQDIAGPITRTVSDAAIMLDVMVGYDPVDSSTARTVGNVPVEEEPPITTSIAENGAEASGDGPNSYTDYLDEGGLEDAGIGIVRKYIHEEEDREAVKEVVETAIDDMEGAGARIVDPVDVPPADNSVSTREFRREMNRYLSTLDDPDAPATLEEILDQPENVHPSVLPKLEAAASITVEDMDENVEYLQDVMARDHYRVMNDPDTEPGNRQQILVTMAENDLDALLYPTVSAPPAEIPEDEPANHPGDSVHCTLSSGTGLPAITFPGGFTGDGLPVGLELLGRPFAEGTLIGLAYAYEQLTSHRQPPNGFGPLE